MSIGPEHCQKPGPIGDRICMRLKGHRGEHRFAPIAGATIRLPDGSSVKFLGFAQ